MSPPLESFINDIPTGTNLFTVRVNTSSGIFEHEAPEGLFTGVNVFFPLDLQRFLGAVPQARRTAPVPVTVVLNWSEEVKQRALK